MCANRHKGSLVEMMAMEHYDKDSGTMRHTIKNTLRQTSPSKLVGIYRILLGIIFVMAGTFKLTLANFEAAWFVQLKEIEIPFNIFVTWFVPFFEIFLGILLSLGYFSRIAAFMVLPIMTVAIYVHLTVFNPDAFLAQPHEALLPSIVIMMAITIILYGGGNWSMDLKSTNKRI